MRTRSDAAARRGNEESIKVAVPSLVTNSVSRIRAPCGNGEKLVHSDRLEQRANGRDRAT